MQQAVFLGAAPSFFRADNGDVFDSTKIFLGMPLSQESAIGLAGSEFKIGKSADFERITAGLKPMHPCLVELEIQTNGRKQVLTLKDIKPTPPKQ